MTTWLVENPEALRCALEIVDEWDDSVQPAWLSALTPMSSSDDDAATSSPSSASSSSSVDSPRVVATSRLPKLVVTPTHIQASRPYHGLQPSTLTSTHYRRREEITYLRGKVAEMERELMSLEQRNAKKRKPSEPRRDVVGLDPTGASLWREIAVRQLHRRTRAETEKAQLRARVDEQMKVARGLVKLIQRARKLEEDEMMQPLEPREAQPSQILLLPEHQQLMRLNEMYTRMDHVFSDATFTDPAKTADIRLLTDQTDHFEIQVTASWTVPFDQHRTLDALWAYHIKRHNEKWCSPSFVLEAKQRVTQTELMSEFTAVVQTESSKGTFDGRAVVRKFDPTDKGFAAIMTHLHSIPSVARDTGDFAGVCNQEESCIRIVPLGGGTGTWQPSRIQVSQRFVVSFDDALPTSRYQAGVVTNMMIVKLREGLDIMHEVVERLLLELN